MSQTAGNANAFELGGITGGLWHKSTIQNCANTGSITATGRISSDGYAKVGGIVGVMDSTNTTRTVEKCYNTGDITSVYKGAGGIVGHINLATHSVTYCYNVGNISAPTISGGIIGYYGKGIVTDSYYLNNCATVTSGNITDKGDSVTEDKIKSLITMEIWKDFLIKDKTPNINKGYPIFNWQ